MLIGARSGGTEEEVELPFDVGVVVVCALVNERVRESGTGERGRGDEGVAREARLVKCKARWAADGAG